MSATPLVTCIPVEQLCDLAGNAARRQRYLSKSVLQELLRRAPLEFAVADIGTPIRRIEVARCFEFWKSEAEPHVVDNPDSQFFLDDFPGDYVYLASQWSSVIATPIILLEKHH